MQSTVPTSSFRSYMLRGEDEAARQEIDFKKAVCRISLASPDLILKWSRQHHRQADRLLGKAGMDDPEYASFGEVKKPETINYRTFKPEKDGLFCERIFGPVKDWECSCGKYKRIKYKGIICDRCGVEVTESKVRRVRMGHIKLAAPTCHIWFYKGTSSRIANLVDISVRDIGKVIYFQEYIVVDAGDSPLKPKQLLTEDEARKYREAHPNVVIEIGAEAVKRLLQQINIDELSSRLAIEMRQANSAQRRNKVIKRLKVVDAFRGSGNKPEWMIIDILPVLPPDLRPLVHLDGGRFATSDLNDLYRRVINRNNRLKRLIELRAPDVILRNEKRMLQESVDALFDNSRRSRPTKGHNNRPLKSLSDMLKGKQGRFRQNLLGKRVDYSGRSVIVVGPELQFNECGLPKKMALELFDPFIIRELQRRGHCNTIKSAKRMIEREEPVVYDILEDIIKGHPVLLNRAPTLHRLGVQAFMPKLIEGKAIRLHPLSCAAFNADFDGDQMAVHVPLSTEAIMEARFLTLAQNNILSPRDGRPIATPSQDIILGCFYLTKMMKGAKGEGMQFASPEEAILAHNCGVVDLQAEIRVRLPLSAMGRQSAGGDGEKHGMLRTTVGRLMFSQVLPPGISFFDTDKLSFGNEIMSSSTLRQLVALVHKEAGPKATARMLDRMMSLGFEYAKKGGISICMDDMKVPESKRHIIDQAKKQVTQVQRHFERGNLTNEERYQKVIEIWTRATDQVAEDMMKMMKQDQEGLNPIYIMANSGARGNEQQIRQLAGMRGLMQKPTKKVTGALGEIIESPIESNFREGLTVLEYFISTHGARKGLADTALKTSDAGYLTRRLVDVAQDLIVNEADCGTRAGITVESIKEVTTTGERVLEPLRDRIVGRVPVADVRDPNTRKIIVRRNEMIDDVRAAVIEEAGIEKLEIRSVLTCETRRGVCAKCYGRNLATGRIVELGEAVGVIAAQSIGEPGTQLTLRTFHIGGTYTRELEGWYQAAQDGIVRFKDKLRIVERAPGEYIVVNRTGTIHIENEDGVVVQVLPNIRYGAVVSKRDGEHVAKGEHLVRWDPHHTPIIAEFSGTLRYADIIPGVTMREDYDPQTNLSQKVIIEHKEERHPQIQVVDESGEALATYALTAGAIISREATEGAKIAVGQALARIPRFQVRAKDITGGLPRVDELFEARKPKDAAFITDISGTVRFRGIAKGARKISIVTEAGEERQYSVPLVRHMMVRDGEYVEAGEQLTDGSISPHDVLDIKGEKAVQEFLLNEVQEVYRLQGVNINDKHIESIIRQMLRKVVIEEVGNTNFMYGQVVDKWSFLEENERTVAKGGEPAAARPKLLGLTKASLETDSFIAAASFQETTRVLTDAAVRGRVDKLLGLKENVIMGLLIPAGTGLPDYLDLDVKPLHPPAPEEPAAEDAAVAVAERPGDEDDKEDDEESTK
ncbi:MAG: DNA-directed RNA polymerase subunit beta' [Candidatus Sumerlaeota bacterium]|nr:DNA-directed RNA polymerase subunit beta' [Candidatus Sumerlaeota bacterium]